MIEFQRTKKQAQSRSTNGRKAAFGTAAVLQRHNENKGGFKVESEDDQFNDY